MRTLLALLVFLVLAGPTLARTVAAVADAQEHNAQVEQRAAKFEAQAKAAADRKAALAIKHPCGPTAIYCRAAGGIQ